MIDCDYTQKIKKYNYLTELGLILLYIGLGLIQNVVGEKPNVINFSSKVRYFLCPPRVIQVPV